jgi:predicted nucleic acid-binding protein
MNGQTNGRIVLDTNIVIDLTESVPSIFTKENRFVSVVSEMEMLAFPSLTPETEQKRLKLLSRLTIVPLTDPIKQEAIRIRRYGTPRLKLPDAIIVATAVILNAALVTNDIKMLNLNWHGLTLVSP